MKIRRRIFIFSILTACAAIIATSVFVAVAAYDDLFASVKREVAAEAAYVGAGYKAAGVDYLQSLTHQSGHRATLISPDGAVVYDSRGDTGGMDNHLDRPEVQAALANGAGESTRFSDTIREQTYYRALLMPDGYVLRVSNTVASVYASFESLVLIIVLIAAAVFAALVAPVSLLTRWIVRPINAIDLEHPESKMIYEEIVPLLKRIREQRGQIETQIHEMDKGRSEFAAITENMSEGFLVLDRSGKVLSYNKSAARMLGAQPGKLSNVNILKLNREENFRETVRLSLEGTAREKVVELQGRQCQLFASPVMEDGNVQGVILMLMDVTEKQERDNLRHEFTSNVSHELKTPLTVISGYAEIMAGGMVKNKDIPEFANNIYREAQRLIVLINDMMFLSGLEENKQPAKGPVNLLAMANEVSRRLAYKAAEQNVTMTVDGEPAEVNGLSTVLDEMIFNLIENAIKYNRPGGSVTVEVKKQGGAATLAVSDTGIGIPKAERDRVFERFYRVDKSHNNSIPGTGLGLSIVKHGAILHGAKLELTSDEGGSRFTLTFPK